MFFWFSGILRVSRESIFKPWRLDRNYLVFVVLLVYVFYSFKKEEIIFERSKKSKFIKINY